MLIRKYVPWQGSGTDRKKRIPSCSRDGNVFHRPHVWTTLWSRMKNLQNYWTGTLNVPGAAVGFFFICGFEWNVTITVGWIVIKFGAQLHVTLVITFSSGTIIRLSLTEPREWLLNNWLQDGKYLHSLLYVSITLNSGSFFVKIPLAEVGLGIMIIMYCETSPNCC